MENLIYIAVAFLLYFLGLLTKNFLPTYYNEKARNLATKEDIEEITKKVESIKIELSFKEKQKSRIKEKENEALLEYFEKCSHLDEKLIFNFGNLTKQEEMYPVEYQKYVENLFYEIRISRQRIFLFLPIEHEIQKKAEAVFQYCADMRDIFSRKFGKYKISIIDEMNALSEGNESQYQEMVTKADNTKSEYDLALKPHYEKFRFALNDFMTEMQKHFAS